MTQKNDPNKEGHSREWQDRARVVADAKKEAQAQASPKQSPVPGEEIEDVEEKSEQLDNRDKTNRDPAY